MEEKEKDENYVRLNKKWNYIVFDALMERKNAKLSFGLQ